MSHTSNSLSSSGSDKDRTNSPEISFLWLFSRNDGTLETTIKAYLKAISDLPYSFELVVINNGVPAESIKDLTAFLQNTGISLRILILYRTAPDSTAFSEGFKQASGKVLVVLPSYVQVAPDDIPLLLQEVIHGGLDYVASWRHPRVDAKSDRWKSQLFNWLTARTTKVNAHDINSGLRAMKRQVIEEVPVYGDLYRFLPVLAAIQGFKVGEVKVTHVEERVAKGDYRFGIYLRRLLDLLTLFFLIQFTRKPLRFFGLVGSGVLFVGALITGILVWQRILGVPLSDRPLLIISVLMVVLGIQLFSIGLLGELIIFAHARDISEFKVEKIYESSSHGKTPERKTV